MPFSLGAQMGGEYTHEQGELDFSRKKSRGW